MCLGGGDNTTTTVQSSDPWSGQQPHLQDIFQTAANLYQSGDRPFYPHSTVAARDPLTDAGQRMLTEYALGNAPGTINTAMHMAQYANQGGFLNADANPHLQAAVQGAIRPVQENFQQVIMPGISSAAQSQGAYGGARHGLATSTAATNLTRDVGDITAGMYSDAYSEGLKATMQSLGLTPSLVQAGTLPGTILDAIGVSNENRQQAQIDESIARWNWETNEPWNRLGNYANMVQGSYGGTTQSEVDADRNPVTTALGGALGGAALGSQLAGVGGTLFGLPGAAVGAGLGTLLSLF